MDRGGGRDRRTLQIVVGFDCRPSVARGHYHSALNLFFLLKKTKSKSQWQRPVIIFLPLRILREIFWATRGLAHRGQKKSEPYRICVVFVCAQGTVSVFLGHSWPLSLEKSEPCVVLYKSCNRRIKAGMQGRSWTPWVVVSSGDSSTPQAADTSNSAYGVSFPVSIFDQGDRSTTSILIARVDCRPSRPAQATVLFGSSLSFLFLIESSLLPSAIAGNLRSTGLSYR